MSKNRAASGKPPSGPPRKEAQTALNLEAFTDAVVVCAPDGTVTGFNKAARELLGWRRGDVWGNSLLAGGFLREAWLRAAREMPEEPRPEAIPEEVVTLPDGSGQERGFKARLLPLKDPEGRFSGFAVLLAHAEGVQAQHANHLMHELRTPLSTILAAADLMEKSAARVLPPKSLKSLEVIRRNTRTLLDLTNDFLDLSRLKRGRYGILPQNVDLADLLAEVSEEVEPLYHWKRLTLEAAIEEGTPARVMIDPEAVRRILVNLLSNACKFTEKGGATLRAFRKEDQLRFCVRDTGVGLCMQEITAIFREFSQAGDRETSRRNGSGLGLVIADRFAKLLGGRIEVESQPGQGSSFTLVVPLAPADAA